MPNSLQPWADWPLASPPFPAGLCLNCWSLQELVSRDPGHFLILLEQILQKTREVRARLGFEGQHWVSLVELRHRSPQDFPGSSVVKNPPAKAGGIRDMGSVAGSGRSPGGGDGSSLQYSGLENPMNRGVWQATVHRVAQSRTQQKWLRTHVLKVSSRVPGLPGGLEALEAWVLCFSGACGSKSSGEEHGTFTKNACCMSQGPKFTLLLMTDSVFMSQVALVVKNLPARVGDIRDAVQSLGQEDLLEKEVATHSSTLAWRILWTEEPGRLQTGSQRVGHDWSDLAHPLLISQRIDYRGERNLCQIPFLEKSHENKNTKVKTDLIGEVSQDLL